ncbi:MAG: DUF4856 domain-containing protein [Bacteroidia bacterium]
MKKQHIILASASIAIIALSVSCKKKDVTTTPTSPSGPSYTIPTTYNGFTNVDHIESTTIIGMTTELTSELAKGAGTGTTPVPLDINHLLGLLRNQGGQFTNAPSYDATYNTSGYQIEDNCIPVSQAQLESYLDTLVAVSNSGTAASYGVAGVGVTLDATPRRYLLTGNGINYAQVLTKNLMCDLVLYQIVNRVGQTYQLDNTTLNTYGSVQATTAEHNWDVAFGYYSVSDSFPTVTTPLKLWGSYSNQLDAGLGCNAIVMNAFLKGRAAIQNKDMATAQQQANIISNEFDIMTAGAVCQELNEIKTAYTAHDAVKVCSALSECKGLIMSMYNNKSSSRKITDYQIQQLLNLFPANHWNVTTQDLTNIGNYMAEIYGFTPAQMLIL